MTPYLALPSPATCRRHRLAGGAVALCVVLMGIVAIPYGDLALRVSTGFLPAFGGATFCIDVLTAVLLFSQARAAQDRSMAYLAIAYLVSVLTIVPHLLAFPGVFAPEPVIGESASAVWLWCVWHAGFALCVCRYALSLSDDARLPDPALAKTASLRLGRLIAGTVAVILPAIVLATRGIHWLPTILVDRSYGRLNTLGIGPFVIACNLAASALVLWRLRGRSVMAIWLSVALVAANVDALLTLYSGGRYTLGWYAARSLSLATGVTVLAALLWELISLFGQASATNRQLELLSLTDSLTEVPNRRAFDRSLSVEWRRALREQMPISLLMIDVDLFKGYNDRYGHPAGDDCLRHIAAAILRSIRRPGDFAARIGGEEFAVILPNTEAPGALFVADLVSASVWELNIANAAGVMGRVTISIGIATIHPGMAEAECGALVAAADQALYRAKRGGRNRSLAALPTEHLAAWTPADLAAQAETAD